MFQIIKRKVVNAYWNFRERCQRFKRGYSWTDVFGMPQWFIYTVEPMLRHFSANHIGYPGKYSYEEWSRRLGEMADLLHYMDEGNVIDELLDGDAIRWEETDRIRMENKDKFFSMFAEDFFNLWD